MFGLFVVMAVTGVLLLMLTVCGALAWVLEKIIQRIVERG